MPIADTSVGLCHDLFPVLFPSVVRDALSDVDHTDHIVPREPIVVHHEDLECHLLHVHIREVKLERFVEDRDESVAFGLGLPFLVSPALPEQPNLHIGICGMYCDIRIYSI